MTDWWLQAEVQKLRVEMAAMKRDAEHYSRQVLAFSFPFRDYVSITSFGLNTMLT